MTAVRHQLFPQKPHGSSRGFSRTGVQPSPASSTTELPSTFAESGGVLRRVRVVESISKTGSPGWVRAGAMPASRASEVDGVFVAENFSYMYECFGRVRKSRATYGERKHRSRWLSNRCPICCHRGSLRGVGVRRCVLGSGVCSRFVRILPGCLEKQYFLVPVARSHYLSDVLDDGNVCARRIVGSEYRGKRRVVAK